jgi:hypothetical protein
MYLFGPIALHTAQKRFSTSTINTDVESQLRLLGKNRFFLAICRGSHTLRSRSHDDSMRRPSVEAGLVCALGQGGFTIDPGRPPNRADQIAKLAEKLTKDDRRASFLLRGRPLWPLACIGN